MHDREQIIQLGKVLAEEQRRGYDNLAVAGGLEPYLAAWRSAVNGALSYPAIQQTMLLLNGYDDQPAESRASRLDAALHDLRDLFRRPAPEDDDLAYRPPPQPSAAPASASRPKKASRKRASAAASADDSTAGLATPLKKLNGIPSTVAAAFSRIGVKTVEDLLYHIPHRYDDYTSQKQIADLEIGQVHTIVAKVSDTRVFKMKNGRDAVEVELHDASGTIKAVFFGSRWMEKNFPFGRKIVLSGKVTSFRGVRQMQTPDWEPYTEDELVHTGRLVPVHPLTKGLHERNARDVIKQVVDRFAPTLADHLPAEVQQRAGLLALSEAMQQIHFPDSKALMERARLRLAFDEFLLIQLGVVQRRLRWQAEMGYPFRFHEDVFGELLAQLPFSLTGTAREDADDPIAAPWNWQRMLHEAPARRSDGSIEWSYLASQIEAGTQMQTLCDIFGDVQRPTPMARLLQGDVGSGKTVVAAAAMLQAVANGFQAALMAPTEILAEQHYKGLRKLLGRIQVPRDDKQAAEAATAGGGWKDALPDDERARLEEIKRILGMSAEEDMSGDGVRVAVLTGSLSQKERRQVLESISKGEVDIIIGTHALITEGVQYDSLGLVVIDEQHRFGVEQRERLKQKGFNPHMLVMTATPIPRTLTLTIYGELEASIINKLPPGRQEIKTRWIMRAERHKAYKHMRREIEKGRQAFVICPLVAESEKLDLPSAEEMHETLQHEVFPDLRIGLIHGRMMSREKDEAMVAFRDQQFDVLVATAVVEVGIDIPNATTIMIEGAERFGLAQLHQFRGRVGRGIHQSYCILVSDVQNEITTQRLQAMEQTRDGFKLAEIDLHLRGPGEFFGKRQSGTPDLKVARLADTNLLVAARREAELLLAKDPELARPEHRLLREKVAAFWARAEGAS
ncbi:MAG: ATP-dependent DNA helicase RecG [Chloroflexaceae bacterium]|nr:ATP-dependent DNA helicase RecG [Chloroflexaceae bacterium]